MELFNGFVDIKESTDYEKCPDCGKYNTSYNWCQTCNSKRFMMRFVEWSSENQDIDQLIRNNQINALSRNRVLEWIPYDQLIDFETIDRGGFGNVQTATWIKGQIDLTIGWNYLKQKWERHGITRVAVKNLSNFREPSTEFFYEMMPYIRTHPTVPNHLLNRLIRVLGITKNPLTQEYAIVMQFAEDGNLRDYLKNNGSTITWDRKLYILQHIAESLKYMHAAGLIYKNFHCGNILLHEGIPLFGDLGLCRPANELKERKKIYGVLPYVAPEVLRTKEYTKESDIYSLAFIMWEMCTHHPPLHERAHDNNLALDICLGERPEILEEAPQTLIKLVNRCWDAIPSRRPTAEEVFVSLKSFYMDVTQKNPTVCYSDFKAADNWQKSSLLDTCHIKYHPDAYYHSRCLEFPQLPEAINENQDTRDFFDDIDDDSDYDYENPHFRGYNYNIRGCKW